MTLLEARERLGGRLLRREFLDSGTELEFGGAWVSSRDMEPLARELDRYGLSSRPTPQAQTYRWLTGGELREGSPLPVSQGRALEGALYELGAAARRLPARLALDSAASLESLDVSASDWIETLRLPGATGELLLAFAAMYGGADPAEVALLAHLSDIRAFGNRAFALFDGISEEFSAGTPELIASLAGDCGAEVLLKTDVERIEQTGEGVRVINRNGPAREAAAVVLAVPINALTAIQLDPPADPQIASAARAGQPCRSMKVWMLAEDVPAGMVAVGWGAPFHWVSDAGELDGARLLVGFGHDRALLDPASVDSVQEALRRFAPDAKVLATDAHDWNGDPFSRGAWGMWRPGWVTDGTLRAFNERHDRVAYASSDFAPSWPGWIAGAISSGHRAAGLIAERLGGS